MRLDGLIRGVHLATMADADGYGVIEDAAIGWRCGSIAWLGRADQLPSDLRVAQEHRFDGAWVTPGLVDCHTHLVHAGNRATEWEMRLNGASYADIARAGGGIQSTVAATRAASQMQLLAQSAPRLQALMIDGVTTVEIKSGYGLDLDTEAKMLRVARALGHEHGLTVRTTFLGAHALPPEYAGRTDDYIDLVCNTMLPALHGQGLIDAVDAFCETIAFSPAQTRRVFETARRLQLPVKLHAEQLSDSGGAALVSAFGGLSADHLEWLSPAGIAAMARAGTVAVLLPGAFYFLRETRLPPIRGLLDAGVPLAIATDCNPGTSPLTSLRLAMNMACTLFGLTPAQALAGTTRQAARALGLDDRGRLGVGTAADLAIWDIHHPAELAYAIGNSPLLGRVIAGRLDLRAS